MNIKSVTLKTGGLKGCDVIWIKPETKGTRTLVEEYKKKAKHPIHLGMERPINDLRWHLLDICGQITEKTSKKDIDAAINRTEITSITSDKGGWILKGQMECFDGKYHFPETPLVEIADNYEHFDTVSKIIEQIFAETKIYLNGEVQVTDQEVALRYIESGRQKGFDREAFDKLPEDEQKEILQDILEKKFGAAVLMPDELEEDTDEEEDEEVSAEVPGDAPAIDLTLEEVPQLVDYIRTPAVEGTGNAPDEPVTKIVEPENGATVIPIDAEKIKLPR